jgi:hypothetical protein
MSAPGELRSAMNIRKGGRTGQPRSSLGNIRTGPQGATATALSSASPRRPGILHRRDPVAALEVAGQGALVVEAGGDGDLGERQALRQVPAGAVDAQLGDIGVRGQAGGALEQADQLVLGQPDRSTQLRQRDRLAQARLDELGGGAQPGAVAGAGLDPRLAAAVAAEQGAEGRHQQLALQQRVPPGLQGAVQRKEAGDQVAVGIGVAGEIGQVLDAERPRHLLQRRLLQIQRAVQPAPALAHPAGMRLDRVEHEQRLVLARRLGHAAGLDDRAAALGDGDDQRLMPVRRVFLGAEIRLHQAEAGDAAILPVMGNVQPIDPGHAALKDRLETLLVRPSDGGFCASGAHGPKRPLRAGSRNHRHPTHTSAFPSGP